jgi:hypothetical protein
MLELKEFRKLWNRDHQELRRLLSSPDQHQEALRLFLSHHAVLHAREMAGTEPWTYADAILGDLNDQQMRRIPHNCEHSVAWVIWHIARIEDVTMNLLVAGDAQLLQREDWQGQMGITRRDTGNAMDVDAVAELSAAIDLEALCAYRLAVGRRTQEIVRQLRPEDVSKQVEPARLVRVMEEGAVVAAAQRLIDYWGKRTVAGLLLMPPTRHVILHLNEVHKLKRRRR